MNSDKTKFNEKIAYKSPIYINQKNAEFWGAPISRSDFFNEIICLNQLNPIAFNQTFLGFPEDGSETVKVAAERRAQAIIAKRAASAGRRPKSDALSIWVIAQVRSSPSLTYRRLRSEIEAIAHGNLIASVTETYIEFEKKNGCIVKVSNAGLKCRLSRAKKLISQTG